MLRTFFTIPVLFLVFTASAQFQRPPVAFQDVTSPGQARKSDVRFAPLSAELHPELSGDDWNFYFRNMEGNENTDPAVEALKKSYPSKRGGVGAASQRTDDNGTPTVAIGSQYDANLFDGSYPPDNTVAVSAGGWKVCVVNSTVRYYNPSNQIKLNKTIEEFVGDASLQDGIFDPRVVYDSGSDRFILCELHGSTPATSKVLLMFSKSGNPMDGWNYYNLPINNDVNNRWADFPNVGVSNNEVYVTVNLFNTSDDFDKAAIYQINKNTGYNGNSSLTYQFWTDISDDSGVEPFTLVPVSYGQDGNYGPGIFFVSTPSPANGSRIQLFDLTNDIDASNETLNGYHVSIPSYQIGANAEQPAGEPLDIGDARMKSAFFLNNFIHCVFTVGVNSQGYNGINYSRINTGGLTLSSINKKYSESGVDLAYPSVASFSGSSTDPTAVIYYEVSGSSLNPGCKAVLCDAAQNFGTPLTIKSGSTYIDVEDNASDPERWGDYTGISRKPNSPHPTVWVFGNYGKTTSSYGVYGNNLCELTDTTVSMLTGVAVAESVTDLNVYPNPALTFFNVRFESTSEELADIALYDAAGKLVRHLATKALHPGDYELGFNCDQLASGLYFLRVTSNRKTIANEKIVVQ